MKIKNIQYGSVEYEKMLRLREEVLRKPLGLLFDAVELEKEKNFLHFVSYEKNKIAACVVLQPVSPEKIKLKQMAVRAGWRGKGLGRQLVFFVEEVARTRGFKEVVLHARETAVGFYQKQGYETMGERFLEVGLPHWKMTKRLIRL